MAMNREHLVRDFAREAHMSRREAVATLEWMTDLVWDALRRGETVTIDGVGTFYLRRGRGRTPVPVFRPEKKTPAKPRR
ncbi:MAG: HU family DNA-binding protein [bacterium]